MAEMKTKQTELSVEAFINKSPTEEVRDDCHTLVKLMQKATGQPATMWGPSIIGFDKYHYKYESGREGEICLVGFSPRKTSLVLYVLSGFDEQEDLLNKLGKHKTGKGCLYIKKLSDVNLKVLETLIKKSAAFLRKMHS